MSDYTKIILKNSPIPEAFPLADFLDHGEIALNYADHKLYYKSINGEIVVHETPNIDVDSTRNSIVRRDPFGAANFTGLISDQDDSDLYSLKAVHTNGTAVKVIGSGSYAALDVSTSGAGPGATISSVGGIGVQAHSTNGIGAFITSVNSTGAFISSANGDYHAVFGSEGSDDRLAVGRSRGALTWFYSANPAIDSSDIGKLQIADISEDRDWFLPDASGTLAVYTTNEWEAGRVLTAGAEAGVATWETPFGGHSLFDGYDNEIHVSNVDGNDEVGNGDLLNPVATITHAMTLVTASRRKVIVHSGGYGTVESPENIVIPRSYVTITSNDSKGDDVVIVGSISTDFGCSLSGLKVTTLNINAVAPGTGNVNILNCDITGTLTKSGYGDYTLIRFCDVGTTTISGPGLVAIFGGNPRFITVSNAAARVIVKNAVAPRPTLTAGNINFVDCIIAAIATQWVTNRSYAVGNLVYNGGFTYARTVAGAGTTAPASDTANWSRQTALNGIDTRLAVITDANSTVTIANSQIIIPSFDGVAPISLSGYYSIFNTVYDKPNSTLVSPTGPTATGGSTNSVDYFQYINADRLIFDGMVNDANNTIVEVVEPTAPRTIRLPDASGTVPVYINDWATGLVLTASGNPGEASWQSAGGSAGGFPAGSDEGQVQLRNANGVALAADDGLRYTGAGNLGVLRTGGGQIAINALPNPDETIRSSNIGIGFNPFIPTDNASAANNVGGNIGIGDNTLDALNSSNQANANNIAIGTGALKSITTCGSSVFIGTSAGTNLTASSNSTIIGDGAGINLTGATSCTFVGKNTAGSAETSNNQIVIGYGAVGDANNSTVIGNGSTTQTRLAGNTLKLGSATASTSIVRTSTTSSHTITLPDATGTLPVYNGAAESGRFLRAAVTSGTATWETAVTSVTAGNGLTTGGSAITTSGSISLQEISPVLPTGSLTNATITVDKYGRVISAQSGSSAAAAAGSPGQVQFANASGGLAANNGLVYTGTGAGGVLAVGGGSIYMSSTTSPTVAGAPNNISIGTPFTGTLTSGKNNVSVGSGNFQFLTSGSTNVACGSYSLVNVQTGSGNTAIGHNAGAGVISGSNNIFINRGADNGAFSSQILIGGKSDGARSTVIGFEGDGDIASTLTTRFIGDRLIWGGGFGSETNRTSLVQSATTSAKIITLPNATGTLPVYNEAWPSTPTGRVLTASSTPGLATWATAVTTVATGAGLTVSNGANASSITGTGTIELATTSVTAGTYNLATIAVDAYGRITTASSANSSGLVYTGTSGTTGTGTLTVGGGGRIYMDSTTGTIQPNNIAIGGGPTLAFASLTAPTADSTGNSKNNVSIGAGNFQAITTGQRNVACGSYSLSNLTIGNSNLAIGSNTLYGLNSGSRNTAMGHGAGSDVIGGSDNIFVNRGVPQAYANANSQIVLGATSDGERSTVIGFDGGGAGNEEPTLTTRFIGDKLTWGSGVSSTKNRTSLVQSATTNTIAKTIYLPDANGTLPVYTTGSWPTTTPTGFVLTASSTTGVATWAPVSAISNTTLSGYKESHLLLGNSGIMVANQVITTVQLESATVFAGKLDAASTLTLPTAAAGRSLTLMIETGSTSYPLTLGNAYQAGAPNLTTAIDSITFSPSSVTLIVCTALIRTGGDPFWSYTVGQSTLTPT